MNEGSNEREDLARRDSRFREFLRQARPVFAAERGVTPRARVLLKGIADKLMLPPALYDEAIAELQEGRVTELDLPRYEREYQKQLQRELAAFRGGVLTPVDERSLIDRGVDEYQLSPRRARDLVRQMADALGVGRVSKTDAMEHLARVIDDLVGDAATVDASTQKRIRETGSDWGLTDQDCNVLLKNRLAANTPSTERRRSGSRNIVALLITLALAIPAAWLGYAVFSGHFAARTGAGDSGTTDAGSPDRVNKGTGAGPAAQEVLPASWSPATRQAWRALIKADRDLVIPQHQVTSDDVLERSKGFEAIATAVRTSPGDFARSGIDFLVSAIDDGQLKAVHATNDLVWRLDSSVDADVGTNAWAVRFRQIDLLDRFLNGLSPLAQTEALDSIRTSMRLHGEPENDASSIIQTINRKQVDQAWEWLYRKRSENPAAAANSFAGLLELTEGRSESARHQAWRFGATVVMADDDSWQRLREPFAALFDEAGEDELFQLFDAVEQSDDPDRRGWLLPILAERLGISTTGQAQAEVRAAVRARFGLTAPMWQPVQQRANMLRDLPETARALERAEDVTAQRIADTVWLTTAAWLLWQAEENRSLASLAEFDQLIAAGADRVLLQGGAQESRNGILFGRVRRRPLPSDIETRRESLEVLAGRETQSPEGVALALRRLGDVADCFGDVEYQQAEAVARCLLLPRTGTELVAVEQAAPRLQHWANLVIAVAEQIESRGVTRDQASTVVTLLLEWQPELSPTEDWQALLRRQVLEQAMNGLRETAIVEGSDVRYTWSALESQLGSYYRMRELALGDGGPQVQLESDSAACCWRMASALGADVDPTAGRQLCQDTLQETTLALGTLVQRVAELKAPVAAEEPVADDVVDPTLATRALLELEQQLLRILLNESESRRD